MDRISGFEPDGVGSIPAGPAKTNISNRLTYAYDKYIIIMRS